MERLKLLDFYINSSIHVSLAIVSFAGVTYLNYNLPLNPDLLLFIFLASITGYNFIKYAGIAKLHHFSLARNVRLIQFFSFLVFLGLLISAFFQSFEVLLLAAFFSIFTVLYGLPVFSGKRNLRSIRGLKIYVIAFVVAGVTVLMPLIETLEEISKVVWIDFIQRIFIALALILPFEIRDLKFDMIQLGTIPQIMGVSRAKKLGYGFVITFLVLEFTKEQISFSHALSLAILGLLIFISLKLASVRQGKFYSSFWVEGIPIMWLVILWVLQEII